MWFKYTGIRVKDLNRSLEFYTKVMGLKKVDRGTMRAGGKYITLKDEKSGQRLELNYYPPDAKFYEEYYEGSELDHLAFWSRDVRKDYERLLANGCTSAVEPWDEGSFTLAFVRDPDGIWIEIEGKKAKQKPDKNK